MNNKIARVCWNTNGWETPSGINGKSTQSDTFECRYTFGHEEWLFNHKMLIGHHKYGFLQPLGNSKANQTFNIYLYSYSNHVAKYVGCIKNASTIGVEEAKYVVEEYSRMGWIDSMKSDLEKLGISSDALDFSQPNNCFNVKFRLEDVEICDEGIFIEKSFIPTQKYLLYEASDEFIAYVNNLTKKDSSSSEKELIDVLNDINLSDSERISLVLARIGQGEFRKEVIKTWGNQETCCVTLCNVREMLIASHIKAWKDCKSTSERLDGANGLLLHANMDKLFDRHLITFYKDSKNTYKIRINKKLDFSSIAKLGFSKSDHLDISSLGQSERERFEQYMQHHNKKFEEKIESTI